MIINYMQKKRLSLDKKWHKLYQGKTLFFVSNICSWGILLNQNCCEIIVTVNVQDFSGGWTNLSSSTMF